MSNNKTTSTNSHDKYLSRSSAANMLWVSTKTVDRYIKKWELWYKKSGSKINVIRNDVENILNIKTKIQYKSPKSEVINNANNNVMHHENKDQNENVNYKKLEQVIDKRIQWFFDIFNKKEEIINDKDKMIFMLQQKVWELESEIKNMVSLPDYSKEKQSILVEKQKLEDTIKSLKNEVKNEKTKNIIYLWLLLIVVFVILLILFSIQ